MTYDFFASVLRNSPDNGRGKSQAKLELEDPNNSSSNLWSMFFSSTKYLLRESEACRNYYFRISNLPTWIIKWHFFGKNSHETSFSDKIDLYHRSSFILSLFILVPQIKSFFYFLNTPLPTILEQVYQHYKNFPSSPHV